MKTHSHSVVIDLPYQVLLIMSSFFEKHEHTIFLAVKLYFFGYIILLVNKSPKRLLLEIHDYVAEEKIIYLFTKT